MWHSQNIVFLFCAFNITEDTGEESCTDFDNFGFIE